MKNQSTNHVPLHLMVNRISAGLIPFSTRKNSFIVNDVPKELPVNMDETLLATVFGTLLNTLIDHTENCCIRISARLYGKFVLLHIQESHPVNGLAFNGNLRQVQQLAEKIGGTISINSDRSHITTIVFSFINNIPLAA